MEKKTGIKTGDEVVMIPMSNVQLAKAYNVGIKTFRNWIAPYRDEIGAKTGRYYTVKQLQIITEKIGIPRANLGF